jgi:hypothetical protein
LMLDVRSSAACCVIVMALPPTETTPSRAPPLLAATTRRTEPLPAPLAPAATVIHPTALLAAQAQPSGALTLSVTSPPAADTARDDGEAPTVQAGAGGAGEGGPGVGAGGPGSGGGGVGADGGSGSGEADDACSIVTSNPATVTVPLRAAPVFALTGNRIAALPEPLAGVPWPIHPALLLAVHVHPSVAERVTVTSPPAPPSS